MTSLKLRIASVLLTFAASACTLPAPRTSVLSDVFSASVASAEVVAASPAPTSEEPAQELDLDLRACALANSDGAPIMERSDAATPGVVALTFDDGPHVSYTPKVLDALARHERKATFFLVGRSINGRTFGLVQRTLREGHTLAVHSYNHEVEMATRYGDARSQAYIVGQYEVTRVLIELALVATSEQDFDALYTRIFGVAPYAWISEDMLADDHERFAQSHASVLAERGFEAGARPVDLVFWRPPGGGPYLGQRGGAARRTYDAALERLGLINVLWHGGSGDTDRDHRHDPGFLMDNLRHASRRGGVLLLHDPIDPGALDAGLTRMKHDGISVVSLEQLARERFGCR